MGLTPMMQQYMQLKEKYSDCILLYRLGDFYEMFFEDAITCSKVLDLYLTGRDCGLEEKAPMCGMPHHAVNSYIAKLVENGFKVAICEQISDPKIKGIVERDVVRVVTPGTVVETDMLNETKSNYIMSISLLNKKFGVSWCDITTGDFYAIDVPGEEDVKSLSEIIKTIMPTEIICQRDVKSFNFEIVQKKIVPVFESFYEWAFSLETATKKLKSQFKTKTLEPYGISKAKHIISSCGALIEYVEETQKKSLVHIDSLKFLKTSQFMQIDSNTERNLELLASMNDGKKYGSLYWLLDKTQTAMGSRLLQEYIKKPLLDESQINVRLNVVEAFYKNDILRDSLKESFSKVRDLKRLVGKLSYGNIMPKDMLQLKDTLSSIPTIKNIMSKFESTDISKLSEGLETLSDLVEILEKSICETPPNNLKDGNFIKDDFNEELFKVRDLLKNGTNYLAKLEEQEKEKTGIRTLKIKYNRVFGYFIEISKSYQHLVPLNYIRKQTVANAERYIIEELKEIENNIISAQDRALSLEIEIFNSIRITALEKIKEIIQNANILAQIDVLRSFGEVARENNYTRATISQNGNFEISQGRHPVVEKILRDEKFISNDTHLDNGLSRTMILTGPNMAGKSTYMRQVSLISLMMQIGSFVPATEANLAICDKLFTRIGASDKLIFDQSTFMVEMVEVSSILNNATKNSLVILDEVGRGTSTMDGLSIAWAVTKYITEKIKCKTLFATHYHELTELEGIIEGIKNYKISVKEFNGAIIFLRKIVRGHAERSFGIEVASLAGLPKEVIRNAKIILKDLESVDIIKTKKQISFTDMFEEQNVEISEVEKQLVDLNLDEISPREAYAILENLKEKAEDNVKN